MARVFIAVGSNIEPEDHIRRALALLRKVTRIRAISTMYRTAPLTHHGEAQPPFINGVIEIETELAPTVLKHGLLRKIEEQLGRVRGPDKYAPRTIDLDLLLYDQRCIDTPEINIPDPEIASRPFLAVPLCELAPNLIIPGIEQSLREIAKKYEHHTMEPLPVFTKELRKEIAGELP